MRTPGTGMMRAVRRFRRNRRGSAAVEFAFVAPIFFALLFALLETALVFFAGQLIETATQDSARMIMTGQAQNSTYTQAQFKTYLCGKLSTLFDCDNGVYIDVQSYGKTFPTSMPTQIDANKNFNSSMSYNPGGAEDIVVIRVFYQWPLFVTGLGYNISNLTGNKRLLVGTAIFRNEPYPS